jgi:hypothetical protein
VRDYARELLAPLRDGLGWFHGLGPDQQRSVLLLAAIGVVALFLWIMYQSHGDRVVLVLPAGLLRISLLLLVLPLVMAGRAAGRGTRVPGFLRRSWTQEPDPDRPQIPTREVNPMRVPGGLRAGPSGGRSTWPVTSGRRSSPLPRRTR